MLNEFIFCPLIFCQLGSQSMMAHPFWAAIIAACIIWYSTITIYVAVLGVRDIRKMLEDLNSRDK